jgi:hypothetical protein
VHTKALILKFNMGDSDLDQKVERSWVQQAVVGMLEGILAGTVRGDSGALGERQYDELVQQQAQARAQQAQA